MIEIHNTIYFQFDKTIFKMKLQMQKLNTCTMHKIYM